jgi:hypothetical protein
MTGTMRAVTLTMQTNENPLCTVEFQVRGRVWTSGQYRDMESAIWHLDPHSPIGMWTTRPLADVLPEIEAWEYQWNNQRNMGGR